jgi:hypothetical protein
VFGGDFGLGYHFWHDATQTALCVPPKGGSSAMKYALLMAGHPHLGVLVPEQPSRVHGFSHLVLVKRKSQIVEAKQRIFVARSPLRRVISAFLSKFVLVPEDKIIGGICKLAEISPEDMTFRTYVQTLAIMPDTYLDPHFCSQEHFFCLPFKKYKVISIEGQATRGYSHVLNAIHPDASENFRTIETQAENRTFGCVRDGAWPIVSGRLADVPVKRLRYLRLNGGALPAAEFLFDGCEALVNTRYAFDAELNKSALAA